MSKTNKRWSLAKLKTWVEELPLIRTFVAYTKRRSLPGFHGVNIYEVGEFVWLEVQRDDLFTRANSIAFSFFLSLFPSLLTLFTLIPFVLDIFVQWFPDLANFNATLYDEIQHVMPGQAGDVLFGFIQEIANSPKIGLLSFGMLLAIYFSSNGMLAMMVSFEKSYHKTFRQRSALRKRLVAVGLTGLLGLLLTASAILVIMGGNIIQWITDLVNLSRATTFLIDASRWVIMLLLYYFTIGSLYRFGAATYRRFSYFSPGVTLAAILSLATSVAFSFYVDEFNRYDTYAKFYGSIATIIIVMLWMQLNALILLIGFELNAGIAVNRDFKTTLEEKKAAIEEE